MKETHEKIDEGMVLTVHCVEKDDSIETVIAAIRKLDPNNFNLVYLILAYGRKTRRIEITDLRDVDPKKGLFIYKVGYVDSAGNPTCEWDYVKPERILAFGDYQTKEKV